MSEYSRSERPVRILYRPQVATYGAGSYSMDGRRLRTREPLMQQRAFRAWRRGSM
jgi:hypothetical protein